MGNKIQIFLHFLLNKINRIVNGFLQIVDDSFRNQFQTYKICKNLYVGSYPDCEGDIRHIKQEGISGIINLLSDAEMMSFKYDKAEMVKLYQNVGINFTKHLPLNEVVDDKDLYADKLYKATKYLDDMLNSKGLKVLIHSSSGFTRATTLLISYLHIFQKHPQWQSMTELNKFV